MIKHKKKKSSQNLALIKYERNRELVHVADNPPSEIKRPSRIKHHLAKINQPLSTQTFLMSHFALLVVSLVFLGGLYFVLNKDSYSSSSFVNEYMPVTMKPASFSLEIKNPDDESLIATKMLIVSGKTSPKSSVVASLDGTSSVFAGTEADSNGEFQFSVSLASGLNQLEITAFDREGNSKSISRTVYYSEEQLQ